MCSYLAAIILIQIALFIAACTIVLCLQPNEAIVFVWAMIHFKQSANWPEYTNNV